MSGLPGPRVHRRVPPGESPPASTRPCPARHAQTHPPHAATRPRRPTSRWRPSCGRGVWGASWPPWSRTCPSGGARAVGRRGDGRGRGVRCGLVQPAGLCARRSRTRARPCKQPPLHNFPLASSSPPAALVLAPPPQRLLLRLCGGRRGQLQPVEGAHHGWAGRGPRGGASRLGAGSVQPGQALLPCRRRAAPPARPGLPARSDAARAALRPTTPAGYCGGCFLFDTRSHHLAVSPLHLPAGPENTPYCGGCFLFDIYFPPDYPRAPPKVGAAALCVRCWGAAGAGWWWWWRRPACTGRAARAGLAPLAREPRARSPAPARLPASQPPPLGPGADPHHGRRHRALQPQPVQRGQGGRFGGVRVGGWVGGV